MKKANYHLWAKYFGYEEAFGKDIPPCLGIHNIQVDYRENDFDPDDNVLNMRGNYSNEDDGILIVRVVFQANYFKEIKQVRKHSIQSLIGNSDGYIGLFVGYALRELPFFICYLFVKLQIIWKMMNLSQTDSKEEKLFLVKNAFEENSILNPKWAYGKKEMQKLRKKQCNGNKDMTNGDTIHQLHLQIDSLRKQIDQQEETLKHVQTQTANHYST